VDVSVSLHYDLSIFISSNITRGVRKDESEGSVCISIANININNVVVKGNTVYHVTTLNTFNKCTEYIVNGKNCGIAISIGKNYLVCIISSSLISSEVYIRTAVYYVKAFGSNKVYTGSKLDTNGSIVHAILSVYIDNVALKYLNCVNSVTCDSLGIENIVPLNNYSVNNFVAVLVGCNDLSTLVYIDDEVGESSTAAYDIIASNLDTALITNSDLYIRSVRSSYNCDNSTIKSNGLNIVSTGSSGDVIRTKSGDDNVLEVGELSKSCIGEYCETLGAVPVLYVTVFGSGRSLILNVDNLCCCRNCKVLSVGELGESCICKYCIALCAVPILSRTVLVAISLNCCNVDDLCCCRNCKVLSVGELGESCICKYCIALCAVPVLSGAVLVARSLNCCNVDDLCCCRNCKVLSVGELGESCICKYCIALCAVPILSRTVLVAISLNCCNVDDLCCCRNCKVLSVGELGESCICKYCIALCAVPVLSGAVLVARSLNCCNVDDLCSCRSDYALEVGELS